MNEINFATKMWIEKIETKRTFITFMTFYFAFTHKTKWEPRKLRHPLLQLLYYKYPQSANHGSYRISHCSQSYSQLKRRRKKVGFGLRNWDPSFFFSFFLLLLNFFSFFFSSCYSHWVLMAQLTTLLMSLLTLFLSTQGK